MMDRGLLRCSEYVRPCVSHSLYQAARIRARFTRETLSASRLTTADSMLTVDVCGWLLSPEHAVSNHNEAAAKVVNLVKTLALVVGCSLMPRLRLVFIGLDCVETPEHKQGTGYRQEQLLERQLRLFGDSLHTYGQCHFGFTGCRSRRSHFHGGISRHRTHHDRRVIATRLCVYINSRQ